MAAVRAMPTRGKMEIADGTLAQVCRLVARDVDGGLAGEWFRVGANRGNWAVGIAAGDDVAAWDRTGSRGPPHWNPHGRNRALDPRREPDDVRHIAVGRCAGQHHDVFQHWRFASAGIVRHGRFDAGDFVQYAMSATGMPGSSALFDGGGTMGNASGTCMGAAGGSTAGPASSASSPTGMGLGSPVGRVGIPLGSTELGVGGLSPPPMS